MKELGNYYDLTRSKYLALSFSFNWHPMCYINESIKNFPRYYFPTNALMTEQVNIH